MVALPLTTAVAGVMGIDAEAEAVPHAAVTVTPRVTLPEQPAVKVTPVPFVAEVNVPPAMVQAYVAPLTAAVDALPAEEAKIEVNPVIVASGSGQSTTPLKVMVAGRARPLSSVIASVTVETPFGSV